MWELLAIQCLVPGVDLSFPSELVINSYLSNTCRLVVAGAMAPCTGGVIQIGVEVGDGRAESSVGLHSSAGSVSWERDCSQGKMESFC